MVEQRDDDFGDRLFDAAIEAEFDTGEREPTEAAARSHVLVRLARMSLGFAVIILGIILLPLPGPGWVIIAGGLVILSRDVVWAERALRYVRRKAPGIPEDGRIPTQSWVVMGTMMCLAIGASLWWYVIR